MARGVLAAAVVVLVAAGCGGGGGTRAVAERRPAPDPTVAVTVPATRVVSPVDGLFGVGDAQQVVVVTAEALGDRTATLTAHERTAEGWRQVFGPLTADIGTNGFAPPGEKREGDGRTPSGAFDLGFGFGVLADPGVKLEYRRITGPAIVWDDDPASSRYNEWVDTSTVGAGVDPEPMFNEPAYNYGAVIAYNAERVPGLGSAIFLHVTEPGPTAGCVAIAQDDLVELLRWLDPAKRPRVVMGTRDTMTP
jgi:L,D-peptidoglycan transpeptidase YkuD (ErfK/YbiS/YcfS/YnhG family)